MQKRWTLNAQDQSLTDAISHAHFVHPLIARILINRNLTDPKLIEQFLQPSLVHLPDPFLLKDMEVAVRRLVKAIRTKERITIYGDYDVDGTTSTAMMLDFLGQVGAHVDYYIPHRMKEGYSLNEEALRVLRQRGSQLVLTVDNGISALKEANIARDLGIDLIITDHHDVPAQLPDAFAVINPKRSGDVFPGKELAGVGVAFFLLIALRKGLREAGLLPDREPNLKALLDLVAVGTVADMAPLRGVNRILVREGLMILRRTTRLGLRALMEIASVGPEITADQIGFRIGPRINAVGRLDDASIGVKLLLSKENGEARLLAERLDVANRERQGLEENIVSEAVELILKEGLHQKFRSLVLYQRDWHAGVVGIVASRLVEKFYLPAIVLTQDGSFLKGSARSIRGLHIVESLRRCALHLKKFGGHEYAAGLTLHQDHLKDFIQSFDEDVRNQLQDEDFIPALKAEGQVDLESMNPEFMTQLEALEPFGLGNAEPLFLVREADVQASRVVGERHLKLRIAQKNFPLDAIGFRLAEKMPPPKSKVDLMMTPTWNEWQGTKNIQLRVVDLRPACN